MTSNWRGVQVAPRADADDITELFTDTKVNLIRCQIQSYDAGDYTAANYKTWLRAELDYIENTIAPIVFGKGRLVLDIHTLPGGVSNERARMFTDRTWAKDTWKEMWLEIAARFKDNPTVYVYGLANEFPGNFAEVWQAQVGMIKLIRKVDPNKRISITVPYSNPVNFNKIADPLSDKNLWVEAHIYFPIAVALQGLDGRAAPVAYPTAARNKDTLLSHLQYLINFSKKLPSNQKIYIGEFSCSTFATDATRVNLLRDVLDICEKYSWNYTVHAWKEASVWDLTVEPVYSLLTSYWNKNNEK